MLDPTLKLQRAHEHLEELKGQIRDWLDGDSYRVRLEPDQQRPGYGLLKVDADEIPADPFSLLIGDVIQNLRSSLDHLAFALATKFTDPLPDKLAHDSQFPIIGNEDPSGKGRSGLDMFTGQAHRRLAGVDPAAKAVIERLQPYHDGAKFRRHPLWMLNELSNLDKHRLPHLMLTYSGGMKVEPFVSGWDREADLRMWPAQVTRDTPIASARLSFLEKMNVKGFPIFWVSLHYRTPQGSVSELLNIPDGLGKIHNHIVTRVLKDLSGFF